jgi:capsular polysaccharide biosynthesis protein
MERGGVTMEEIDLRVFLLILRKRLWAIALITILCMGISGLVSYYILEPEYQTYTTLIIGRPQDYKQKMEYNDILLNQKLVSTYGEIVKSKIVANEFMSNLGLNFTYEELDKKISVTLVKNTEIIKILVKDKDGKVAAQIANEIANVFIKHVTRIMNIENIQVIDKAEVPLNPNKPKPIINMVIASVLGILLSVFLILIYEYFDNTVKTSADIEKNLGLPIIGTVPKMI